MSCITGNKGTSKPVSCNLVTTKTLARWRFSHTCHGLGPARPQPGRTRGPVKIFVHLKHDCVREAAAWTNRNQTFSCLHTHRNGWKLLCLYTHRHGLETNWIHHEVHHLPSIHINKSRKLSRTEAHLLSPKPATFLAQFCRHRRRIFWPW
jgi:hypothetical protein